MNLKQLKAKAFENESVKQEYDNLGSEFELINKLINIRKKQVLLKSR